MKAQRTVAVFAAALVTLCVGIPLAASHGAEVAHSGAAPVAQGEHIPYLGIAMEPVSPVLVSHMPKTFAQGQGILVTDVAQDSPAEKGGLKVHDVLMSYGDQKLFSPRQLVGLVRQDKPGRQIALSIVREGTPLTVKVTLGTRPTASAGVASGSPEPEFSESPMPGWVPPFWRSPHRFMGSVAPPSKPRDWESFDSMTIKKLDKGRFHVEIQYLNKKGGLDRKTFEGNREEIHKAIVSQKDLPPQESQQLLRSLDLPTGEIEWPGMSNTSDLKSLWKDFRLPAGTL